MNFRLPSICVSLVVFIVITSQSAVARSFRSFESPHSPEDAKQRIEAVLERIAPNGYRPIQETQGFSFLIEDRWSSPFEYRIFIGTISKKAPTTLIRIEGSDGEVRTFARIFEIEGVYPPGRIDQETRALNRKSHAASQGLNWIAPWIGVYYDGYHSPRITKREMITRSIYYFLYDAFAVYAGKRDFFIGRKKDNPVLAAFTYQGIQEGLSGVFPQYFKPRDPIQENAGGIAALMILSRAFASYHSFHLTSGHNSLVELNYTFAY